MCTADVGLVSYVWVKDAEIPTADFNTAHKCKNFDAIRDWMKNHQILEQGPEDYPVRQTGDREMDVF